MLAKGGADMTGKTPERSRTNKKVSRRTRLNTDTSSYEQVQGAADPAVDSQADGKPRNAPALRRHPRQPHERDESASGTGDRLQEERPPSDDQISVAREGVEAGQVDTDRRGVPNDLPNTST
jgi:hypothetical protein